MEIQSVAEHTHGGWLINGNMRVPPDPANADYQAIQEWIAAGNVPTPVPEPTIDQHKERLKGYVQAHMDTKAGERNYDGIMSLCTYATDPDPIFMAEGQAGVDWRSAVWRKCYQILADVQNGVRPVLTKEELLAELPVFTWPA